MKTRVIIADDHAIVRAGLRLLLSSESDMEIVGEADGGKDAYALVNELFPEILILDLSMPDMDGIELSRLIHTQFPQIKILILTVHQDESLLREAMKVGASGYILKQAAETELITAIRTVQKGDIFVQPSMLRALLLPVKPEVKSDLDPEEVLTPREREILFLIIQGYTNKEIADELGISPRTVEGHRANLTAKLNISSRVDLLRYARSHGLIS